MENRLDFLRARRAEVGHESYGEHEFKAMRKKFSGWINTCFANENIKAARYYNEFLTRIRNDIANPEMNAATRDRQLEEYLGMIPPDLELRVREVRNTPEKVDELCRDAIARNDELIEKERFNLITFHNQYDSSKIETGNPLYDQGLSIAIRNAPFIVAEAAYYAATAKAQVAKYGYMAGVSLYGFMKEFEYHYSQGEPLSVALARAGKKTGLEVSIGLGFSALTGGIESTVVKELINSTGSIVANEIFSNDDHEQKLRSSIDQQNK